MQLAGRKVIHEDKESRVESAGGEGSGRWPCSHTRRGS
jgi:hypothetical protein